MAPTRGSASRPTVRDVAELDPEAAPRPDGLADRLFWSGHANPWSVWTFVLAYPTLVFAIYRRNRPLLLGTLVFVAFNPILAPSPSDDRAWATRVVLGERQWLAAGVFPSRDLAFAVLAAPVYLFTLGSAARRQPVRTVLGTIISMVVMLLFFDRMTRRYDGRSAR